MNAEKWKARARRLKTEPYTLYIAAKDPRVPWYAKLLAVCVVAYAVSPIDLIPDFIPILGYVDDLIIIPLGISLTLKLIPAEVVADCREKAQRRFTEGKLLGWIGAAFIIAIWIFLTFITAILVFRFVY
jgi:uncharacterized membrane protein YkvA (DUF1232 family)